MERICSFPLLIRLIPRVIPVVILQWNNITKPRKSRWVNLEDNISPTVKNWEVSDGKAWLSIQFYNVSASAAPLQQKVDALSSFLPLTTIILQLRQTKKSFSVPSTVIFWHFPFINFVRESKSQKIHKPKFFLKIYN